MCPACWGVMAMVAAGVATTGALGVTAARLVGAGRPLESVETKKTGEERRG
jgi:hypothetical protein